MMPATARTIRPRARRKLLAAGIGAAMAAAAVPAGGATAGTPREAAPCSLVQPCRLSVGLEPSFSPSRPILTPDGDTAVFVHMAQDRETLSLYSVPVRGGADPVRLDPPHAPPIGQPQVSPDGTRVLYLSEGPQGSALYSVPITGPASAAVLLSPNVQGEPQISLDSRLVAFQTATARVRAVPLAGPRGRGVNLTGPGTNSFGLSTNSKNLVYTAAGPEGGGRELLRVPLTLHPDPGRPPDRLSGPMAPGGNVHSFRLPAGVGPVVYSADQDTPGVRELFSVGFGGGRRTKLNVPIPPGWGVGGAGDDPSNRFSLGYGISPDGRRVVYTIRLDGEPRVNALFSVPSRGPATLSRRLDIDTPNTLPESFLVTPGSRRMVYLVEDANAGPDNAFSVPIGGPAGARVKVSAGGRLGSFIQVSPNGERVVSRMQILNEEAVLSGPADEEFPSPDMIRLNGSERPVGSVAFDPRSQRVAYIAKSAAGTDLFSSALEVRSRVNLTVTLNAAPARLAVSDQHAVYYALVAADSYQLYSSRLVPGSSG